jgi:hypothetical protein
MPRLFKGPTACLCCTLIETSNRLDCSFWPWRWKCTISNDFFQTVFEEIWFLLIMQVVRLISFYCGFTLSDTRSTCCSMEDSEGKRTRSTYSLWKFSLFYLGSVVGKCWGLWVLVMCSRYMLDDFQLRNKKKTYFSVYLISIMEQLAI